MDTLCRHRGRARCAIALSLVVLTAAPAAIAGDLPKDKFIKKMMVESPPADDKLIVPGWRIGPLYLGMSVPDLLKAMGTPDHTDVRESITGYQWGPSAPHRIAVLVKKGKVVQISSGQHFPPSDVPERTSLGISGGTHEMELVAAMGEPEAKDLIVAGRVKYPMYCYVDEGVTFSIDGESSRVISVIVAASNGTFANYCE